MKLGVHTYRPVDKQKNSQIASHSQVKVVMRVVDACRVCSSVG